MLRQTRKYGLAMLLVSVLLGACITAGVKHGAGDRGLKPPHKAHEKEGLACTDCHAPNDQGEPGMPNHDMCSTCHDFDVNKADERCAKCHTRPEQQVDPIKKILNTESKFNHKAHAEKVECAQCHGEPDKFVIPKGNKMEFCMECHKKTRPELTECSVCHKDLNKNVRPGFHEGVRIPHDNPQMWETLHGQESKKDPEFCLICHDREDSCEKCHRTNPPKSHTVAWRGRPHGMRAAWDREKCSACHEEDSCVKCHRHTQPDSHRGSWGGPVNRHCVSCHFPPSDTQCTVCHENMDHPKAVPSPHIIGIYPGQCGACHPGGVPYRAPHMMNTSIRCWACH